MNRNNLSKQFKEKQARKNKSRNYEREDAYVKSYLHNYLGAVDPKLIKSAKTNRDDYESDFIEISNNSEPSFVDAEAPKIKKPKIEKPKMDTSGYAEQGLAAGEQLESTKYKNVRKYNKLMKFFKVSKKFAQEFRENLLYSTPEIANQLHMPIKSLTKLNTIPSSLKKLKLQNLQNTYDIVDQTPILLGDALINQLLNAPKQIVARMYINALNKLDRPSFIIRNLLQCEVNGKQYMLVADEKYQQNLAMTAYPLVLLAAGETILPCEIARLDLVGCQKPRVNKKTGEQDLSKNPAFLINKFRSYHGNIEFNEKTGKAVEKMISAANHMHVRSSMFENIYAVSFLHINTVYRTSNPKPLPSKFMNFNAVEFSTQEIYSDKVQTRSYSESVDLRKKAKELKDIDYKNNAGIINTTTLQRFMAQKYNITNYTSFSKLNSQIDNVRKYDLNRTSVKIDPSSADKEYFIVTQKTPRLLESKFSQTLGLGVEENVVLKLKHINADLNKYGYNPENYKNVDQKATEIKLKNMFKK